MKKYKITEISPDWAQIHGEVNGFAVRHFDQNRYYWLVSFYSFLNNHVQMKANTNDKNRTIHTLDDVRKWIDKAIADETAELTDPLYNL
jgi:hypothetical protein